MKEVCRDGLHFSGNGEYVLINNSLDKVCNFLEAVQHPRLTIHREILVWMKYYEILNFPKNLNSLRNKINDLRILIQDIPLDYFVSSETKLDTVLPTAQFHNLGYEKRARRDRNKYVGGLIEFVKKSVIWKRIQKLKTLINESF